jgi:hypothetical protein
MSEFVTCLFNVEPLVTDGRSQFLVHTGKRTCAQVGLHFCFDVSYIKLHSLISDIRTQE